MTIYEKNLEALAENQTKVLDKYLEIKENGDYTKLVQSIETRESRDGNLVMTVATEMEKVRLNSPYCPQKEAEKWADQFAFENIQTVMVMFGLGNGLFVREALQRLQEDAKLIVYEPGFEVFDWVMNHMNISDILADNRFDLYVEEVNGIEFEDGVYALMNWANMESQIVCKHTGYDVLFRNTYSKFLKSLEKIREMVTVNIDTQIYFAKSDIDNILHNFKYIRSGRSISDCVSVFSQNATAIIVSAGPSLDKNIELLRDAKGKAFIIATDTAVRHMIKRNIMPDVMVTIDANKPTNYISDPVVKDIPMFCTLTSNYEIMKFHTGIKIWFNTSGFLEHFMETYNVYFPPYSAGGSVATASFAIAAALKFKRIVLIGQDLAYSGGVTHAGGEVSTILNEQKGQKMIEGIDGNLVRSRHDWIRYLDWFEKSIIDVQDEIQVIDATEGGALIHGATLMTLQQVIDEYCQEKIDFAKLLGDVAPVFDEQEYCKIREDILRYPQDIVNIQRKVGQAKKLCDKIITFIQNDKDEIYEVDYAKKLQKLNNQMQQYTIYMLVDVFASQKSVSCLKDIYRVQTKEKQTKLIMYKKTKEFYENLQGACRELYPKFDQEISNGGV